MARRTRKGGCFGTACRRKPLYTSQQLELFRVLKNKSSSLDDIKAAIKRVPNLNKHIKGEFPLIMAIDNYKRGIIRLMKAADADMDFEEEGESLAHFAKDNLDALVELAAAGAPMDLKDKDGRTPLSYAVSKGNKAIVRELLEQSADPNVVKHVCEDCQEILDMLCIKGAKDEKCRVAEEKSVSAKSLPSNAEDAVTMEEVRPGTRMVDFNSESARGRFYTAKTYNSLRRKKGSSLRENPFTRAPIESVLRYTAKVKRA